MQLNNSALWKTCSFINGEWVVSDSTYQIKNPANQEVIADVCEITSSQLEQAITTAQVALKPWQDKTVDERAALLRSWEQLILNNREDLAAIMTLEQGKPGSEAVGEVVYGAKYIEWYAEEARRINGAVLPVNQSGRRALVLSRPVGVVTAITPWNFPGAMILRKAAAALAAGCCFIVKPSELTPLSALALAELSHKAGIPAGVFNVVTGSNAQAIGEVLTMHPLVAKFSFTGSTPVGKKLLSQCAFTVKKTSMELGGNAPFIAFEDADISAVVKGIMGSKFRNAGQTCVCANRIFIHKSIFDEVVSLLKDKVESLIVGPGSRPDTHIGPLINSEAVEKVEGLVNLAIKDGARIVTGGKRVKGEGHFFQPTILTGITPEMEIFNREIFGPVASIIVFDNEQEVIQLANQTPFGLCSYAYTQNATRIWRLSEALDFGMVGINEGVLSNPSAPFGGVKESGLGREGGSWGINEYLETRYVCIGGIG